MAPHREDTVGDAQRSNARALPGRHADDVKLLAADGELYVLARSRSRILKERATRKRRLKRLWQRLHELRRQALDRATPCCSSSAPRRRMPGASTTCSTSACRSRARR